jgi:hypothetical protein
MDQIYLPESGRGTGENRADMSLTKAVNSGEEIQLTYLGKLNNGSLAVEKTYRIPANANRVMVHLKLTNVDLVNPQSVGISYRSHSMLSGGLVRAEEDDARVFMVATQGDIVTVPSFPSGPTDTAFSNVVHGEQYRNLLWTSALKGTARNVCGEYLPKLQLGVVFQLPSDFLQIYRWQGKNMGTVEWMTKVAELASGKSTEFSYEMEICTAASPEEFKNKLTQIQPAPHFDQKAGMPSANMLPFDMRKDDGTGLPKGFLVTDLKKNGKVTFDNEVTAGTSGPSVRVDLPEDGTVRVDTADAISLKTNTLYLFSVQIKAQKVSPGGAAMNAGGCYERGVFAYVHSATKAEYACSIIVGKGDTDGWVTLMLPFDTGKFPAFEKVRFLLRCIGISGTVWFQNPALVEMPDGFEIKPHFILSNGEIVPSTLLVLQ